MIYVDSYAYKLTIEELLNILQRTRNFNESNDFELLLC